MGLKLPIDMKLILRVIWPKPLSDSDLVSSQDVELGRALVRAGYLKATDKPGMLPHDLKELGLWDAE